MYDSRVQVLSNYLCVSWRLRTSNSAPIEIIIEQKAYWYSDKQSLIFDRQVDDWCMMV